MSSVRSPEDASDPTGWYVETAGLAYFVVDYRTLIDHGPYETREAAALMALALNSQQETGI